jgi:hypothetical protein
VYYDCFATRRQPFFRAIIDFISGKSARQKQLGRTGGTAAAFAPKITSVKFQIIESMSAPDPTLSSEKFESIRESISGRKDFTKAFFHLINFGRVSIFLFSKLIFFLNFQILKIWKNCS